MKTRLKELIETYRTMLELNRSNIRRKILEEVIEDLETILREAQ